MCSLFSFCCCRDVDGGIAAVALVGVPAVFLMTSAQKSFEMLLLLLLLLSFLVMVLVVLLMLLLLHAMLMSLLLLLLLLHHSKQG